MADSKLSEQGYAMSLNPREKNPIISTEINSKLSSKFVINICCCQCSSNTYDSKIVFVKCVFVFFLYVPNLRTEMST